MRCGLCVIQIHEKEGNNVGVKPHLKVFWKWEIGGF